MTDPRCVQHMNVLQSFPCWPIDGLLLGAFWVVTHFGWSTIKGIRPLAVPRPRVCDAPYGKQDE